MRLTTKALVVCGLVALLALAACASRPENVMVAQAVTVQGVAKVDMLVATSRRPAVTPGEVYSGDRNPNLSFTNVVVSIPPDAARRPGDVQWPSAAPGNPATDFVTASVNRVGAAGARQWIDQRGRALGTRRVLMFVHGFNNRFDDAVYRFAQVVHDSDATVRPILFTWPSRGSVFAYGYDRESAMFSRDALEQTLNLLIADPTVGEIDILAHSMGNMLVLETLRQMGIRHGHIPSKIDDVMLAAPDVDVDVFANQIHDMGKPRPNFSLFVSRDDKALALSKFLWGSDARLGAIDPNAEPFKSALAADGIQVFDLTEQESPDKLNHGKFANSPELVKLLGQQLYAGGDLNGRKLGVTDQIVGALAAGVGNVTTAVEESEAPPETRPQ